MKNVNKNVRHLAGLSLACCSAFVLTACVGDTNDLLDGLTVADIVDQSNDSTVAANAINSPLSDDSDSTDTPANDAVVSDENNTSVTTTEVDTISNQPEVGSGLSTMQGYVDVDIDGEDAVALFTRSNIPVSVQAGIPNAYIPVQDECVTYRWSGSNPPEAEFESSFLSAGEVITITAPSGTLGELQRSIDYGNISYQIPFDEMLSNVVPYGTVVDIPGDEFPAFSNVRLPEISPFDVVATTGEMLTSQSSFTWTPNSTASATYIRLFGAVYNYADINDQDTYETLGVTCHLLDDGSFSFPEEISAELGSDFNAWSYYIARKGVEFQRQGDSLLAVVSSSEQPGTPY